MKWLITADWQTKFSNLDACERAHHQELRIIEKHKIGGHIDLGDLKDDFNPVDVKVMKFQLERKEAIHQAVTYDITLMGNHDMLGQTAEGSNWLSLFDSVSGYNVTTSQTLHLGNCLFSCLPFQRNPHAVVRAADQVYKEAQSIVEHSDNPRRVLLFHFSVLGARWNKLTTIQDKGKITLKGLHSNFYDRCFGGHIHLRQYLSKNTMYVGNPFAADQGEIDQDKGFIIYDDVEDRTTLVRSRCPGIYSWGFVRSGKHSLVAGSTIKEIVEVEASSDYHKILESKAAAIEHKYPDCIAYVVPRFRTVDNREAVVVDPNSSDFEKIRSYVRATAPVGLVHKRKALIQYIATTLSNATGSGVRQSGRVLFDSVHAQNVLSLSKVDFSFRKKGIVLVKGVNKDSVFSSNGAGKTNFLSLLSVGMFGRTFKGQQSDAWANDKNTDKAIVRLTLTDDQNRKLEVIRGRRPVKLKFKINESDESTGRRHVGKRETQGLIEETTGYTFDTLASSVYIDQTLTNAFLTGTEKTRAALIHTFQNMDRFKLAQKLISKELSVLKHNEMAVESEQTIAEDLLEQAIKDIKKHKKRKELKSKELKAKVRDAKDTCRQLIQAKKQIQFVQEKQSKKLQQQIDEAQVKFNKLEKEVNRYGNLRDNKQNELDEFSKIDKRKDCPTCSQPLTAEHKTKLVARYKKYISAQNTEIKKITKQMMPLSTVIVTNQGILDKQAKELDLIDDQCIAASYAKERALSNYKNAQDESKQEKGDVRELIRRKCKHEKTIKRTTRMLKHFREDHAFLLYAQESMGRDGLPSFLNKMLCPQLNAAAAKYSEMFIDNEIQVRFDVEEGHITPSIVNLHGGKSIASQSTGEKAWAGIITSFALREIAQPTNLLVLDEPGHGLDEASAKLFGTRLSRLKSRFETILVVSHNPAIVAALDGDNSITVVKHHGISTVRQ